MSKAKIIEIRWQEREELQGADVVGVESFEFEGTADIPIKHQVEREVEKENEKYLDKVTGEVALVTRGISREKGFEAPPKDYALTRAKFFEEVYDALGRPDVSDWTSMAFLNQLDYCFDSAAWAMSQGGSTFLDGLYRDRGDYFSAITFAEVGYFLIFLFGLPRKTDWSKINQPDWAKISVQRVLGQGSISVNLKDYTASSSMQNFLEDLKKGSRYIPLPMYLCMLEVEAYGLIEARNSLKELRLSDLPRVLEIVKKFKN